MAKSLIVRNVDEELVRRLKMRAARHNRSAEAEHREILRQVLLGEPDEAFAELAARLRARTRGRVHTPSEQLQHEGRDSRADRENSINARSALRRQPAPMTGSDDLES